MGGKSRKSGGVSMKLIAALKAGTYVQKTITKTKQRDEETKRDHGLFVEKLNLNPNFYTSEPYLRNSGVKCYSQSGWIWVEADGWAVLPPLPLDYRSAICFFPDLPLWADFDFGFPIPEGKQHQFLDLEYLYDSKVFLDLSGGRWNTFRKNSRKWMKSHERWVYTSDKPTDSSLAELIGVWLERKQETVQDGGLIIQYLLDGGNDIYYTYLCEGDILYAVNAWDENYRYVNYRFCIIRPDEPWLDEFVRLLFYTDEKIQGTGKLVNDGGVVGSVGLTRFKDKLHPVEKRSVYSWIKN
jgi:hypothetical protein